MGGVSVSGNELRSLCGLRSASFTVTQGTGRIQFVTEGYGHGVGMSQNGAKVLALKDGRVLAFGPPADVLTPELLEALYGVRVAVTQVLAGGRSFSVCTPYAEEGH